MSDIGNIVVKSIADDVGKLVGIVVGVAVVIVLTLIVLWPSDEPVITESTEPAKVRIAETPTLETHLRALDRALETPTVVAPEEWTRYENFISAFDRMVLDDSSKTEDADAKRYDSLHGMITPYREGQPLSERGELYERLIAYAMNDRETPGFISEWESNWIFAVVEAKEDYEIDAAHEARKKEFTERFRK